jgi:hypothetical protein
LTGFLAGSRKSAGGHDGVASRPVCTNLSSIPCPDPVNPVILSSILGVLRVLRLPVEFDRSI